ncbi:outer membrane protein [Novosphingobium sp.]|uniref:outer membrane protein n=1 Tax=Novosphingobium sp. TaxID=1874826 RepID=UPI003D0CCD09
MKTVFSVAAAAMVALLGSPAWAQDDDDAVDPTVALTPVEGFGGLHVEASVGWDHLNATSIRTIDNTITQTRGTGSGAAFGGAIGYDIPLTDKVLIGAELGVYGSTAKFNNSAHLVANDFNTSLVKIQPDVFIGGRVGFVLNRKTEVYAKAGLSTFHFSVYGTDGSDNLHQSASATGLRGGIGLERQITKVTYVKVEYDYTHYGSEQFNFSDATPNASVYNLRGNRQQAMLSFGFRF